MTSAPNGSDGSHPVFTSQAHVVSSDASGRVNGSLEGRAVSRQQVKEKGFFSFLQKIADFFRSIPWERVGFAKEYKELNRTIESLKGRVSTIRVNAAGEQGTDVQEVRGELTEALSRLNVLKERAFGAVATRAQGLIAEVSDLQAQLQRSDFNFNVVKKTLSEKAKHQIEEHVLKYQKGVKEVIKKITALPGVQFSAGEEKEKADLLTWLNLLETTRAFTTGHIESRENADNILERLMVRAGLGTMSAPDEEGHRFFDFRSKLKGEFKDIKKLYEATDGIGYDLQDLAIVRECQLSVGALFSKILETSNVDISEEHSRRIVDLLGQLQKENGKESLIKVMDEALVIFRDVLVAAKIATSDDSDDDVIFNTDKPVGKEFLELYNGVFYANEKLKEEMFQDENEMIV